MFNLITYKMSCFSAYRTQGSARLFRLFFSRNGIASSIVWPNKCPAASAILARGLHSSSAMLKSAGEGYHKPSGLDKKILVWTKMYKDDTQIPEEVTQTQMKKAKDVFRIRVNLMMIGLTVLLCIIYIYSGRKAAERGESVARQNRLWHSDNQKKAD